MAGRSDAELDALVEQATVDAYGEYEQLASFQVVIEEHLAVPFQTTVLGVEVTVTKIDLLSGSGIVAICSRGKHRQTIGILDLPLPAPPPAGAEWIDAYRHWATRRQETMSEYQYYEFLAVDRPLDERQQAEVRALSTRARVTATSFTNEYHWGNFRGDPRKMMERYYDAHLYLTNWGTHQVMLRLPRALLSPETAGQYCIDPHVAAWTSGEHLILDLISEDESGDWVEGSEDSLSAIVGVRAELTAGDLRPLYLAWLAAYGTWERDEDAFDYDEENDLEPPVPPGLGAITAPQRALADFLRLDAGLLTIAAQASPPLAERKDDPRKLAKWIRDLPVGDKDKFLHRVAQGHGAQVQMELRRRFRGEPGTTSDSRPRRTVAELLDAAADARH